MVLLFDDAVIIIYNNTSNLNKEEKMVVVIAHTQKSTTISYLFLPNTVRKKEEQTSFSKKIPFLLDLSNGN